MSKRVLKLAIVMVFGLLSAAPALAETPVYIGDTLIKWTAAPEIVHETMLVPVADVCDALGATYQWHQEDKTVTLTREFDGVGIWMQVDNQGAYIHDMPVSLEVPPMIFGERILVPLRFSAEAMGETVVWDEQNGIARITDTHTQPQGNENRVWAGTWFLRDENVEVYIRCDGDVLYGNFIDRDTGGENLFAEFEGSGNATTATLNFNGKDGSSTIKGVLELTMMQEGNYFEGTYEDSKNLSTKRDWFGIKQ